MKTNATGLMTDLMIEIQEQKDLVIATKKKLNITEFENEELKSRISELEEQLVDKEMIYSIKIELLEQKVKELSDRMARADYAKFEREDALMKGWTTQLYDQRLLNSESDYYKKMMDIAMEVRPDLLGMDTYNWKPLDDDPPVSTAKTATEVNDEMSMIELQKTIEILKKLNEEL